MTDNIKQLLKTVVDINKKYDTIARATGANFNVFDLLNAANELDVCRVLHALLNPKGLHGQGAAFLKAFFDTVLTDVDIDKSELDGAAVAREHLTDNQRRIDIYIETKSWAIPIEVKINAQDQQSQCFDYQQYAMRQKKNFRLYYLTPTGRTLSRESAARDERWIEQKNLSYITFAGDILGWLEFCVLHIAVGLAPIREVLLQYMAIIRKFCNKLEDNVMNDTVKTIMSSAENIKGATNIADSLNECRCQIMSRLFAQIEKRVPTPKLNNEYDWNFEGKAAKCCVKEYPKKYCCPGISYYLKNFKSKGKTISIWARCEIDFRGNFFVGLCAMADGIRADNKPQLFNAEALIKHGIQTEEECVHVNFIEEWVNSDWWLYWDFVQAQNGEIIDFLNANSEAYFSLFDAKGFEHVVENCVKAIDNFLSRKAKFTHDKNTCLLPQ